MKTAELNRLSNESISNQASCAGFIRSVIAVLVKDLKCELRTRHALSAVLLFAVTSTVAVSFTLNTWGSKSAVASALLWLVLYFSAMSGLSRSFVHEEETLTSSTLKLAASPNSVYLGKLAFNFVMLIMVEIVTVPLFIVFMGCNIQYMGLFIALLLLGSLGMCAGATMAAAMVARAAVKGALFAVISFPLLMPVLAAAIHGTNITMDTQPIAAAASDIRILCYYCGVVITASLMLFRYIWES